MTDEDALWDLVVGRKEGILATLHPDGRPQLSNVLYLVDPETRMIRVSTTASRVKARNLRRDPRAALHVAGGNFWAYAVVEGEATLSEIAAAPGDAAVGELLPLHSAFYGKSLDPSAFGVEMISNQRLVIRLQVTRLYGVIAEGGRRPMPGPEVGAA